MNGISLFKKECSCLGSFAMLYKGIPNADDQKDAATCGFHGYVYQESTSFVFYFV